MFKAIKEFFTGKPAVVETPAEAPYKVPEPAATTPIPLVVETAPAPVEAAPVEAAPVAATTPAPKKAPAKKQQFDKKPAVKAKTSRPRKPKAKPAVAK